MTQHLGNMLSLAHELPAVAGICAFLLALVQLRKAGNVQLYKCASGAILSNRIIAERGEHDCFVERNLYDLAVHCNV